MNPQAVWPWRAIAVAVVAVVVLAGAVLAWRSRRLAMERRDAFGALTRDLRPGMPLDEATGYLRRRGIAFTVDSGDAGPVIAGIGRASTADGRVTQTSEQQIEFDAQGRLRRFPDRGRNPGPLSACRRTRRCSRPSGGGVRYHTWRVRVALGIVVPAGPRSAAELGRSAATAHHGGKGVES